MLQRLHVKTAIGGARRSSQRAAFPGHGKGIPSPLISHHAVALAKIELLRKLGHSIGDTHIISSLDGLSQVALDTVRRRFGSFQQAFELGNARVGRNALPTHRLYIPSQSCGKNRQKPSRTVAISPVASARSPFVCAASAVAFSRSLWSCTMCVSRSSS